MWGSQIAMDYLDGNPCLKQRFDEMTFLALKESIVLSTCLAPSLMKLLFALPALTSCAAN